MGDAAGAMIGQDRQSANFFVQSVENPFRFRVAKIVDPLGEKRKAGTLTYEEVIKAQADLEAEINAFEETSRQFESFGKDQAKAVRQARKNLYGEEYGHQQEGSILHNYRQTFIDDLKTLKPAPTEEKPKPPSENAPSLDTILTRKKAEGAAEQQRKRALAGGRSSTILTGPGGLGKTPDQNRNYTILGYRR